MISLLPQQYLEKKFLFITFLAVFVPFSGGHHYTGQDALAVFLSPHAPFSSKQGACTGVTCSSAVLLDMLLLCYYLLMALFRDCILLLGFFLGGGLFIAWIS